MWKWLDWLLYGTSTQLIAVPPVQEIAALKQAEEARGRSSLIFDSHIMTEAASSKNPQAVSLAWDEGRAFGYNVAPQNWMGMTPRERKETLLSIYIANPWASNCIDSIALYITSGGLTIEPRVEKPDERQRDEIEEFLRRINEDWDFNQYVYDMLTDEMIFGEAFTEYTMKGGKPYQLFSIDNLTMDTEHDKYGMTTRYKQQLTSTSVVNYLDPKTIIRWWNPHKRAKVDPFSPLEGIQDAILQDKKMVNWTTTFFQKGAKFPFSIEGITDQDEADRYITWFKANYTGEKNAQTPIILWGGAKLVPSGKGSIDIDFDKGLDRQQAIVLANFHVPPAIACISETGNRLTDMSDSQRKILQYIACDPRRNKFFEKFNYRLVTPYWSDWYVSSRYADFRDDEQLAKVADMRVRNGTRLIDEIRQEEGRDAYPNGVGQVPVIVVTRDVVPVPRLKDLEEEQRQTAEVTLDQARANADLAQTKAKQAKEDPGTLLPQKGQQGDTSNATKPEKGKDDGEEEPTQQETHQESDETDDVRPRQDQSEGNESLHPTQESLGRDSISIDRGSVTSESTADQGKAALATWITSLFSVMKERGASLSPTAAMAVSAYSFSDQEQEALAQRLASTYSTALSFAYHRDMAVAGLASPPVTEARGVLGKVGDLLSWGRDQVASIVSTMSTMLTEFVSGLKADSKISEQVGGWIDRYSAYKAPQISNVTWGTGANDGSMAAIEDIVEATKDPNRAAPVATDSIRIRVVPGHSSSDACAEYAGKDYSIPEYLQLGISWPMHPGCIHGIEAVRKDGEA